MHDGGIARGRRLRVASAVIVVALLVAAGSVAWALRVPAAARAGRKFAEARTLRAAGDLLGAEHAAADALALDPTRSDAALLAAECAESRGDFQSAAEFATRATGGSSRTRLRAALLAAKISHYRVYRLSDAEAAYRRALTVAPDDVAANTGLATLLGMCGRRSEAVPYALRVVRKGVPTDLVVLFARQTGAVKDPELLSKARRAAPDDPNPLLGLAWQAASDMRTGEAIELINEAITRRPTFGAAHAALGVQLLAATDFERLTRWSDGLPASAVEFGEVWAVRGRIAEHRGDLDGAIRCHLEATRRAPEIKDSNVRLARLLTRAGDREAASLFAERAQALQSLEELLDRTLFSDEEKSVDSLIKLCESYESCGRIWEAYGWSLIAVEAAPEHDDVVRRVQQLRRKVVGLPLRLTADASNIAAGLPYSRYPLPKFELVKVRPEQPQVSALRSPSFRDDAEATELEFRYFNGTPGPPSRRMFEFTGGGIGILDVEFDGLPDVFFTQGKLWSIPGGAGRPETDRLFRNVGPKFLNVTDAAGLAEDDFGQGVAAGDFDADGFPDLYVANIGPNRLWRNNGDGTFADATNVGRVGGDDWTTSCVVADLNGDGFADLYDVNYLAGDDVFDRVCRHADGSVALCMPYDFEGEPDRFWSNSGDGSFVDASATVLPAGQAGKGLGAVAWSPSGDGRVALLVANDTTPNFLLVPEIGPSGEYRLVDRGIEWGVAFNADGKATGAMGIAVGDIDNDGRQDLYVTNFLAEGSSFYVSPTAGIFEDKAPDVGLRYQTVELLGFGTQCLDADLDGHLEIFASNGHIDDLRRQGKPYDMQPQMFRRCGPGFEMIPPSELGPYFESKWLGRAVARLDWNRDGGEDLVVGHLDANSSLLTNTTTAGHSISLRLSGVRSDRDAVGTQVRVRVGDRTLVRQLTAGDGYQASNERRLVFGIGVSDRVDEIEVSWKSGLIQRFSSVRATRRYFLREGGRLLTE